MARWFRGKGLWLDEHGVYVDVNQDYSCRGYRFLAGDIYTNVESGNVFTCNKDVIIPKTGRYHRLSTWRYLRTDVVKAPYMRVTNLAFTRKGNALTLSWKIPSSVNDKGRNDRPNKIRIMLYRKDQASSGYNGGLGQTIINNLYGIGTTKITYNLPRNEFYPFMDGSNPKRFLKRLYNFRARVWFRNDYGIRDYVEATYSYNPPRVPTIAALAHNANTGVLSAKIDTNKGEDALERYHTAYYWTVQRSFAEKPEVTAEQSTTSTSLTVSKDIPDRQNISYGQYIRTTLTALSRGLYGDSKTVATRSYTMSFPNKPTISQPNITREPNSGRAVFAINTKVDKAGFFPVTGIRFQRLVSVDYARMQDIPASANWQNVGPQDNGSCTAMSIATEELFPEAGKKTWVRVKTWNDIEAIFYRYSDPIRLTSLETPEPVEPSAGDDYAAILSCKAGDDGTSAQLLIGWDQSGTDDSNWTEVSWATNERSWRSTEQPKSFTFADQSWNEGQVTSGGKTYRKSAHIDVMDLEPGQRYFIAARRMMKPEKGDSTFGPYSTKVTITPSDLTEAPESVTISADGSAIRGDAIPLSWTYNGTAVQQSWSIRKMVGTTKSASDIVLASGKDERRFFNLPYYRNDTRTTTIASSTATDIRLYVECMIAGVYVDSEPVTVGFLDRPTFEVSMPERLITQPALVTVFTNDQGATASIVVESTGIASSDPEKDTSQSDGDTIWSGTVTPSWQVVSSIADQTDVQRAKAALDLAQGAYDEVMGQYEEAKGRYDLATSTIETLEPKIADESRDLTDAMAELAGYQARLDGMDEDDPMYEVVAQDVQSATEKVSNLNETVEVDGQDLSEARAAQTQAQSDMDAIDYSDEQEELESTISAYATAVANATVPSGSTFTHRAVIRLPEGLRLLDNGGYRVRAFATNPTTGVSSVEDSAEFTVSWEHQAPIPSADIMVTGFDETDENGSRTIGARIGLPSPTRAFSSDVYDIYRVSRDGTHLALSDVPVDSSVTDGYAPFGNVQNGYAVACRTADGDVDWLSYDYLLSPSESPFYSMVRVDWDGKYVELDRNVGPSDSFEKDFTSHKHLDGSVSGHWNKGIMRTLSISAAIVRGYEVEQERLLRELARYDGPCLVRTTDGLFVEGNVSVDGISFGSRTAKGDISLTVTEITPTGTFAPTIDEEE